MCSSDLKEAGVVDSGGQGLVEVLNGACDAFQGKEIDYSAIEAAPAVKMVKPEAQAQADIRFGYCTEFIIMTEREFSEQDEALKILLQLFWSFIGKNSFILSR